MPLRKRRRRLGGGGQGRREGHVKNEEKYSMRFGQMLVPCMGSIHKHFVDGKMVPF